MTAGVSGVILIAVGLLGGLVMRNRPSDIGEIPDGVANARESEAANRATDNPSDRPHTSTPYGSTGIEFTTRQALRTRAFWLLALGHGIALFVVSAVLVHLVIFLHEEAGYSVAAASAMLAVMTGFSIAGQLIGGYFGDRFDKRMLAGGAMLVHGLAMFVLALSTSWLWVVLFAVLQGSAWGVRGPLMLALRADWFGVGSYATVMGISSVFVMAGMTLGPIFAGVLADSTGSYSTGFMILGAAAVVGSGCFFFSRAPLAPRTPTL
jgi:MFS family permease